MATATTSPSAAEGTQTIGVCAPAQLAAVQIRAALADAGRTAAFWHEDLDEATGACQANGPTLLLLSARRPDPGSLACVGSVVEAGDATKVILVCERLGEGDVRKALDAGVRGLVAVGEVESALLPVIDVVCAGQLSVPRSRRKELRKAILTAREKQILGLVVMGMTNAEIATRLFLAESTVKSHLSSAFAKLGVSSRSEAASVILDPQSGAGLGILTIPTK
jgi:DNA-binding NarL/FixJ family response regulator